MMFGVHCTGTAEFYIFSLRKSRGLAWRGKRLPTNFKYLLLTVDANLLVVLRIGSQRTLCFLFHSTVVGVDL